MARLPVASPKLLTLNSPNFPNFGNAGLCKGFSNNKGSKAGGQFVILRIGFTHLKENL